MAGDSNKERRMRYLTVLRACDPMILSSWSTPPTQPYFSVVNTLILIMADSRYVHSTFDLEYLFLEKHSTESQSIRINRVGLPNHALPLKKKLKTK